MKIIAEIGLNHCGDENRGKNLVHDLLQTGVDGITFQVRESSFYDHSHPRKKELKDSFYFEMSQVVKESGKDIGFAISRPEKINILPADFWKTLSWDLGNIKFLKDLRSTERPILYLRVCLLSRKLLMYLLLSIVLSLFTPNLTIK